MLMIRLARVGARKQPHYRIVVIEKDRARNGRSVEVVGTYNPRTEPATYDLKRERIEYWAGKGAQLSTVVAKLMAKPVVAVTEAAPAVKVAEPKTAEPKVVESAIPEIAPQVETEVETEPAPAT